MIWETAQAGNRASKTGRCLQWWDSVAEQIAVASVQQKVHNYHLLFLASVSVCVCVLRAKQKGALREQHTGAPKVKNGPTYPIKAFNTPHRKVFERGS